VCVNQEENEDSIQSQLLGLLWVYEDWGPIRSGIPESAKRSLAGMLRFVGTL